MSGSPDCGPDALTRSPITAIRQEAKFWMVWTKTGRIPRFTHHTKDGAVTEAQRLAHINPGRKFIVLEATDKFHVETPEGEI